MECCLYRWQPSDAIRWNATCTADRLQVESNAFRWNATLIADSLLMECYLYSWLLFDGIKWNATFIADTLLIESDWMLPLLLTPFWWNQLECYLYCWQTCDGNRGNSTFTADCLLIKIKWNATFTDDLTWLWPCSRRAANSRPGTLPCLSVRPVTWYVVLVALWSGGLLLSSVLWVVSRQPND